MDKCFISSAAISPDFGLLFQKASAIPFFQCCDEQLREKVKSYPEDWNSVRKIIPKKIRMAEINTMEAEYLKEHPDIGYPTEIIPLKKFPDYIDYLPHGCIVRKIRIMGQIPEVDGNIVNPITISREEYHLFVAEQSLDAVRMIYP